MGDHYQPDYRPGDSRGSRDLYYGRYDDRDRGRYDERRYRDDGPRDGYYTFRGAADRHSQHHQPEEFTFKSQGPAAPRFPPVDHYATRPPPPQQSRTRGADARRRQDRRPPPGPRGGGTFGNRGRGAYRGRAAHTRDILSKAGREPTPELLEGMNVHGQERFHELESSSEESSDDEIVDLTGDSDDDAEAPRKRTKVHAQPEIAAPKWSNPDPYTALPPPETLGAPKKDIVQAIRKAKVEAAQMTNSRSAVKENVDFISFNFDDDFDNGEVNDESDSSVEEVQPPAGFSHRDRLHANMSTQPTPQAQSSVSRSTNAQLPRRPSALADVGPPSPPLDFVMPTDEELMDQYVDGGKSRGKKRKYEDFKPSTVHDVIEEWEPNHTDPSPWCKVNHANTAHTGPRLHKEIWDFFEFVRPYDYEEAVRQNLVKRVEQGTRTSSAPGARSVDVRCFGSFAAGLYLPTADMDLVAVSPSYLSSRKKSFCQVKNHMWKLARSLEAGGVAPFNGVNVIAKARVPIIKFTDKISGIRVDISFENDSGLLANQTFQKWKAEFPAMPVLVVLIKQMLAMRGLNEVFTGGIGGFTIICLVVSMMQLMPELQAKSMNAQNHYGDLLLNFLDLYGNKFDIQSTGISMDPPGYFDKKRQPQAKQNAVRLTIIDPNNASNDISGGSSRIDDVLNCFRHAHAELQRRLAQIYQGRNVEGSILGCIWGGNYTSFIQQREKLSLLHRGYRVSPPPPPPPASQPALKRKANANVNINANGNDNGNGRAKKQKQKTGQHWKQPQAFVPAEQNGLNSLPPSRANGQTLAQPLPAKPGIQRPPPLAQNGVSSAPGSPPPRKKRETTSAKHTRRAKQFKAQFPDIPNVPNKLTNGDIKELSKKHGFKAKDFDRHYKLGT